MNKPTHLDFQRIGARIVNAESEPYEEPKYWLWIVGEKDARMPLISTPFDTPTRAFNEALFWANETHGVSIDCECHEGIVFSIPLGLRESSRRCNKRRASVFMSISYSLSRSFVALAVLAGACLLFLHSF
jgi:hypothetical protein